MSSEHVLCIGTDFISDVWSASCSCGWTGRTEHKEQDDVVDEWENHCDAAFIEATEGAPDG